MVFVVVSVFLEISAVSFIMLQATPNPAEVKYQSFSSKWSKLEASLSLTDGCFDVPRKLETSGLNKQIMVWNQWARQTHMTALSVKALKQLSLELMVEATSIYSNSLTWLPSITFSPFRVLIDAVNHSWFGREIDMATFKGTQFLICSFPI